MTPTLAIALTAVFTAVSCALLGAFLVLRKLTMVGDAISHAVLPGLAVAYWLSQSRASFWMFLGAAAVGVFATVLIEVLRKKLKVQSDASIGMTFTTLFALGVILITFLKILSDEKKTVALLSLNEDFSLSNFIKFILFKII